MKLALETGAIIHPVYVFGATDMFDQLTPISKNDHHQQQHQQQHHRNNSIGHIMESISRRIKGGLTLYWGKYYLPIPHTPRLTMVMGDPIYPSLLPHTQDDDSSNKKRTCPRIEHPTSEQIEELMSRYVDALERLFEQYKVQAGNPNDVLEIL